MADYTATCRIERRTKGKLVVTEPGATISLTEDELETIPASAIVPLEVGEEDAEATAAAEKAAAEKAAAEKAAAAAAAEKAAAAAKKAEEEAAAAKKAEEEAAAAKKAEEEAAAATANQGEETL